MLRLGSAWVLVNGLLMAPLWVSAAVNDAPPTGWLSVEAVLVVAGLAFLPRRPWSRGLAWVSAAGIVLSALVLFADLVFRVSLGRALNLSLDLYLVDAVYRLAVGNTGFLRTLVGFGTVAALAGLSLFVTARLLAPASADTAQSLARLVPTRERRLVAGVVLLGLFGFVGAWPVGSLVWDQARLFGSTREERLAFAADLERQPRAFADLPGLFEGLESRNVAVVYVESYGMAALEDPDFAAVVVPRLRAAAADLEAAGLHMVTGRLTSPTVGGQSWYAHSTMLSGLWVENQLRYELLLASGRETLVHDFRRAGYRTATVMPAITTAWPEADLLGYDDVYDSQNIPYEGPPFYWVTMPDQFTWSFLGRVLRESTVPRFVEVGMLSSHAPWTPVLPLVDWDAIGEGTVFEPFRLEGYPPEEIWWDVDVLRDGYARSVAYSLQAMTEFASYFLDERTLLVVAGDHQAAPWVTGATSPDVPVHVLARDPALLDPFVEWGFRPGALPRDDGAVARMDEFREWFVRAFSGN